MKLFYVLLLITLPSIIFAQSNYQPAYILQNNGDTIKGYIDYREWSLTPLSINFKTNKNDRQGLEYGPGTIRGFRITGLETYRSYKGIISMNKNNFPDLPAGLDTSKTQGTVFLKQLATGSHITLLYEIDGRKSRFFIAETNTTPIELTYYQYYSGESNTVEQTPYKAQLTTYINKYDTGDKKLLTRAERAPFEASALTAIVNQVNGNPVDKISDSAKAKDNRGGTRLFGGITANFTRTRFTDKTFFLTIVDPIDHNDVRGDSFVINSYSKSLIPKLNFGIDVFGNPNIQQYIFRTEISLSYISVLLAYPELNQPTFIYDAYSFNQLTVGITPQIIYNIYNTTNLKVYADLGVTVNLSSYSNNKIAMGTTARSVAITPPEMEHTWISLPVQAGVVFNKKFEVCLSFSPYATYARTGVRDSNETMGLGVKYLFGK